MISQIIYVIELGWNNFANQAKKFRKGNEPTNIK